MKKVFVVFLLVFLHNIVNAQSPISTGSLVVGGDISFSSQSFDKVSDNTTTFSFSPQVGYFLVDNLYSAIMIDYQHVSSGSYSTDQFGIGPSVRYYFDVEKVKPFLGAGFTYYEQSNGSAKNTLTTTEIKLSGGADFFLTNYLALEASMNYSFINYNLPSDMYLNNTDQSKLFQLAVGARYFIY